MHVAVHGRVRLACMIANRFLICRGMAVVFLHVAHIIGALTSYELNALQLTYKDTSMVIIITRCTPRRIRVPRARII